MPPLNTTLLAAASILAATLSTSALAADKAEQRTSAPGNATTSATIAQAAPTDATSEKARAEFLRARKAGELEYGHEFQIAETSAFKRTKPDAKVQVATH